MCDIAWRSVEKCAELTPAVARVVYLCATIAISARLRTSMSVRSCYGYSLAEMIRENVNDENVSILSCCCNWFSC